MENEERPLEYCDYAIYKKEVRMIEVTDNWYPCYDGNKIELQLFLKWGSKRPSYPEGGMVKMIASGADDTYVDREYYKDGENSLSYLEYQYSHWKKYIFDKVPNGVNKKWFYEHGFDVGI